MNEILNYIKVSDTISTSGQPTKEQFKLIAKNGFDVVINLALHNSDNAVKNEDKIVSKNNMMFFHLPISWETPEVDRLKVFLELLQVLQAQKKKVWIHCAKNYRVSIFVYHYKKTILKDKNAMLVLPKDFKPNKTWKYIIKITI